MIGSGSKACPRCAERVKAAAQVCRYCGHEFAQDIPATNVAANVGGAGHHTSIVWPSTYVVAAVAVIAVALMAMLGWTMSPRIDSPSPTPRIVRDATIKSPRSEPIPAGPELAAGESFEWSADKTAGQTIRQVGPLVLKIVGRVEDDMVAPVVTVSRGNETVTMVGELVSSSYTHRISAVRNVLGAPLVIMFQSFSGGAHCCNHVQFAGISAGRLKIVDLGSWDSDQIPLPTDLSGDGIADIIERDNAFLYAFAPYAMSYAPPIVFNVAGGRAIDVSRKAAFRKLYSEELAKAGEACRTGEDGTYRNGACPSYVASAARVGKLNQAWADMIRSYAADQDWEFPTGCAIVTKGECPEASRIVYKSYPEALLAFLKEHGYVAANWTPPMQDAPSESYGDVDTIY